MLACGACLGSVEGNADKIVTTSSLDLYFRINFLVLYRFLNIV